MNRIAAWIRKPKNRRHVYRVVNAGVGVGVVYGVATGEEAAALLLLVNATLGLADANVPDAAE